MDGLLKSETFSCRISPDERDFLNESALDILGDNQPSQRNFLMNAVTTATQKLEVQKKSLPQDQEMIKDLKDQLEGSQKSQNDLNKRIEELEKQLKEANEVNQGSTEKIQELKNRLEIASESNENLSMESKDHEDALQERDKQIEEQAIEITLLQSHLQDRENELIELKRENEKPNPSNPLELRIMLDSLTQRLLVITSERLARKYKKEVTPAMILKDMFLRYTRDQNAQWFYPFVITKREFNKIVVDLKEEGQV